jgi:hypothetical protein
MLVSSYMGVPLLFLCKVFKIDNLSLDLGRKPVARQGKSLKTGLESSQGPGNRLFDGITKKPRRVPGLLCCSLSRESGPVNAHFEASYFLA